ncbi:MAG: NUDIX hydrolase, partial [Patescibacteria group bacterium]
TLELFIFESDPFVPSAKTLPRVFLSYRKDDYYDGWHLPGGYLGANETNRTAIRRIVRRELGARPRTIQCVFTLNRPNNIREHQYSGFFAVTLVKAPRLQKGSLEYFSPSQLPPKLIPYYRKTFTLFKKIHTFSRTLPKNRQRKFLEVLNICEISGKV